MKKSRIFLTTLIIDLLRFVLKLAFWLLLLKGLIVWQSHLSTIHYQRGDVLDERFRVLAVMEQGKIYPVKLTQFAERRDWHLQREPIEHGQRGDFYYKLTPIEPDVFELYLDLDTAVLQTRYRMTADNRVEPMMFQVVYSIGTVFAAVFFWLLIGFVWYFAKALWAYFFRQPFCTRQFLPTPQM
ncbi:hypothetical protein [Alysiella crassa]|uniref:Uncharacterized protein n=1 Tax=Alysiella crassa TaxID=153491 RepID=A0A376BNE5_9NEIS|nr:hypothetical protein [Alysiella crassa]UOP06712.1 hypothetical protein LVJ80_13440 [Alysiella crassa]SSY71181.1 Uncharacterised protein [Alysiella crassa]